MAPSTQLWHPYTKGYQHRKRPGRVGAAHAWQEKYHCDLALWRLTCHPYVSCAPATASGATGGLGAAEAVGAAGARWSSCYSDLREPGLSSTRRVGKRRREAARGVGAGCSTKLVPAMETG